MRLIYLFLTILLFAISSFAQSVQINGKSLAHYISNTAVFEENQTSPHAPIAPFDKRKQAIADIWTESEWVLSLNGTWKFMWSDVPESASWNFYTPNYENSMWDEITVPSCWQMQGFGDLKFRNVSLPK